MSILKEIKRLFGVKGASIEEALKNVDSIGGGSGGGVFITTADIGETSVTLDKTWQEIHDAISGGMIGVIRSARTSSENPTAYTDTLISAIFYSAQGADYEVMTYENGTQMTFTTATADGYPSFSESTPDPDPGPQ